MSRIVVALGGNALGDTAAQQQERIGLAAPVLADIAKKGHQLIICHGNGPQVGMVQKAFESASGMDNRVPPMELPECTAMSQGYIGYHLQKGIGKALRDRNAGKSVSTVVTQVAVDEKDPAFLEPTKPIGAFYSKDEAENLSREHPDWSFMEDSGRGWRRVVPSPKPKYIVERDSIEKLLDSGFVVIACGGGGIPVLEDGDGLKGVAAVIDKDHASAKLAEMVDADELYILTAVDKVALNFGTPQQRELDEISVKEAEELCRQGQFGKGSMLPKVEAAMGFVRSGKGRKAVIASLDKAAEAVEGLTGTKFVM